AGEHDRLERPLTQGDHLAAELAAVLDRACVLALDFEIGGQRRVAGVGPDPLLLLILGKTAGVAEGQPEHEGDPRHQRSPSKHHRPLLKKGELKVSNGAQLANTLSIRSDKSFRAPASLAWSPGCSEMPQPW